MKSRGTAKKGKLSGHFSSDSHKEAIRSYAPYCDALCHIDIMLDKSARKAKIQEEADKLEDLEAIKVLMDVAKTLARQGFAFRGDGKLEQNGNLIQMTLLVARHCPLLDCWLNSRSSRAYNVTYLAPESRNEMITLLADQVGQEIILDIKQAGMFSVFEDTTPDLSKSDQMTVVCRFIGTDGTPKEQLLAMKHVTSKSGDDSAKDIIDALNIHSLNADELCFQSYDFAASMSGRYNGAQQKLQERLNKVVPYIPCQAHRSNTALEHSCNASPIIKDMFTSSTKRFVLSMLQALMQPFLDLDNAMLLCHHRYSIKDALPF